MSSKSYLYLQCSCVVLPRYLCGRLQNSEQPEGPVVVMGAGGNGTRVSRRSSNQYELEKLPSPRRVSPVSPQLSGPAAPPLSVEAAHSAVTRGYTM